MHKLIGPSSLSSVTGMILAGGLGTRLRAVVADRPKVMADVGGRPFLAWQLDQLQAAGIRRVILCTGYMADSVRQSFGDSYSGMTLRYSVESTPLGTAGALRLALPQIDSDRVLVLNGDSYCDLDFLGFWQEHCRAGLDATLAAIHMPDASRYGRVITGPACRLERFEEKKASAGAGWINAGIYLIQASWLQDIPAGASVSLERETFPHWIARGIHVSQSEVAFLDIGTPESYAQAEAFLKRRRSA